VAVLGGDAGEAAAACVAGASTLTEALEGGRPTTPGPSRIPLYRAADGGREAVEADFSPAHWIPIPAADPLTTAGALWESGSMAPWAAAHNAGRRRVTLPAYPFSRVVHVVGGRGKTEQNHRMNGEK
jgi:acyl transferase domain-containing protein